MSERFTVQVDNRSSLNFELLEYPAAGSWGVLEAPLEIRSKQAHPVSASVDNNEQIHLVYRAQEHPGQGYGATYGFRITFDNGLFSSSVTIDDESGLFIFDLGLEVTRRSDTGAWLRVTDAYHSRLSGSVAGSTWGKERLDVFAIAPDGSLSHGWWSGGAPGEGTDRDHFSPGFQHYERLPNTPGEVGAFAVASWGADRIDGVAVHARWGLSHFWWDGGIWRSEPLPFPDATPRAVAAVSMGAGNLEMFATAQYGRIHHNAYRAGEWLGWVPLQTSIPDGAGLSAARMDEQHIGLYFGAAGDLGFVECRFIVADRTETWPLSVIPGAFAPTRAAVCSWAPGRSDVFALSPAHRNAIAHYWRVGINSPWSGPELLSLRAPVDAVAAATAEADSLIVYALVNGEIAYLKYPGWGSEPDRPWAVLPWGLQQPW